LIWKSDDERAQLTGVVESGVTVTSPAKPFMLVTVRVSRPTPPRAMSNSPGDMVRVKPTGNVDGVTLEEQALATMHAREATTRVICLAELLVMGIKRRGAGLPAGR
jgi:hypothetical protein